ncbi:MAG: ABC transporter ATP-binding protein [Phycisphaerales bacterium]|nr:ABC transporter ATP-binding protein [Phycisphaerales bacterium]
MALAVDLSDVEKTYGGRVRALRGVSVQVNEGEVFGFLGPNGAGKSTLVKIMMTVARATKLSGTILGAPVGHKPTLARVGYLPEHHRFPKYLTGRQVVEFFGALAGMERAARKRRASHLLDMVRMEDWADRKVGTYSKGMQQRVGLAASLVNDPRLIVLDEPTDGVDPVGRREIRDMLIQMRNEGRTVFLNSHLLSEVEQVCNRVAILVQGRVVAQGTIDELTAASRRFEIAIEGEPPAWWEPLGRVTRERAPGQGLDAAPSASRLVLLRTEANGGQASIDRLRAEGRTILFAATVRESLEDLFIRAVADPTTGVVSAPGATIGGVS